MEITNIFIKHKQIHGDVLEITANDELIGYMVRNTFEEFYTFTGVLPNGASVGDFDESSNCLTALFRRCNYVDNSTQTTCVNTLSTNENQNSFVAH